MPDTEYDPHTVEVLNRLYARLRSGLLPRLKESHSFVSRASASDVANATRLENESTEHEQWLAEAIFQEGGGIYPAGADIHTGHLHYLELRNMMPRIEQDLQSILAEFQQAQEDTHLDCGGGVCRGHHCQLSDHSIA